MASTRKSRNVNKRFSRINEDWADKDGPSASKNKARKKKLSDMLGSQWSKEELERFYDAYRKYGKDWRKVAATIRNRSLEMVEALYNMNKAYLSLPEGMASAAGLIAMMTDHYNILEGSDSERENNSVSRPSRKPQKRGRGKYRFMSKGPDGPFPDLLQYQSGPSSYGCLSLLKRRRSGGSQPRAVGKRTPRIPVSSAHVAALALAEVSQRGGSPQVSRTPGRRGPVRGGEKQNAESEMADSKFVSGQMDIDGLEGSLGSREAENGDFSRDASNLMDTDDFSTYRAHEKAKKIQGKRPKTAGVENDQFDDDREACSGTEEGLTGRKVKDETDEATDNKTSRGFKGSRKRSRQLFFGDESTALDALQTLADLSVNILLPSSTVESGSSAQLKEESRNDDIAEKPTVPESVSANHARDKSKFSEKKDKTHSGTAGVDVTRKGSKIAKGTLHDANALLESKQQVSASVNTLPKRKRKSSIGKLISKAEPTSDSQKSEPQKMEVPVEEGRRAVSKGKRVGQFAVLTKQGKSTKEQERNSVSTDLEGTETDATETGLQVSTTNQVTLPRKSRSRRKIDLQKALAMKESKSNESTGDDHPDRYTLAVNNRPFNLKEKLSHCLSSRLLRRWCVFEWFYSAIDYPWFAKTEFVEYLDHVKLGHVPRLTRVEWGVIRSSLGKPRRLSYKFLQEEREKLELYRESVRTHYAELQAGIREGLPTDLARPLSVGQRVVACHPRTREIHDGSVLTVDRNRCRVQFDRPELGVEFVMDVDCMPLNPLESMPEALKGQNPVLNTKLYDQSKDWKIGGATKFVETSEIADGTSAAVSNYPMNTLMKQAKGDTIDAIVQAKAAVNEVAVAAQQAMYSQPCTLSQIQAREADVRALAELRRALDKKEALLIELRHMNEEVSGKQDNDPIKDLEHFRKQYAMVLLQLRDANDQVATALLYLRQRNKYYGPPWLNPIESSGGPAALQGSSNHSDFLSQDPGSNFMGIVQSSRQKARTMVDVAVQAMHTLKEGEDAFIRIGEALDLASNRNSGSSITAVRCIPPEAEHELSAYQNHTASSRLEPTTAGHAFSPKPDMTGDGNEAQFPSELISSCVATLFMIQTCTERQCPPAEVAQILDSAVTSLQPCCPQNLPIYREIETCMGIIKNQMLALIPTPSNILPSEAAVV